MIKTSQNQTGSAHVLIVVILVVALLGALGFIFWQNLINKEKTKIDTTNTTSQTHTKTSEDVSNKEIALIEGDFDGETGTFQARGYLYTEEVPEPYCETDCITYKRAFFYISESPNKAVNTFISENTGNSFVADSAIALGCVIDGKLQATGISMGASSGDKTYSKEVSSALINSNKSELVSVQIGRSAVPDGRGAPVCYSHFDSVSML